MIIIALVVHHEYAPQGLTITEEYYKVVLDDAIEGQMTGMKGVGRRRTQLLDDLRNRRRYWELKEEAED